MRDSTTNQAVAPRIELHVPGTTDAGDIWQLAGDTGVLERNSSYTYVLLCTHFADTSVVAREGDALAGFVVGYLPPRDDATLFVWQVAVADAWQGHGVGQQMLAGLLERTAPRGVRFLEATVEPTNTASRRLFTSVARALDAACEVRAHFPAHVFAEPDHGPEDLFRIGPVPARPG